MEHGVLVYSRKLDETRFKQAVKEIIRNSQLAGPLPERNQFHGSLFEDSPKAYLDQERVPMNSDAHAPYQFGIATPEVSRGPLVFSSSFESGNLASARYFGTDENGKHEYQLHMEGDTHATYHTQWYNFIASSKTSVSEVVTFKIVNFRKKHSLHSYGMQPYVYSEATDQWDAMACQNVSYGDGGLGHRVRGSYVLTFTYTFQAQDAAQFCMYPPYTYTALRKFTSALTSHVMSRAHVAVYELCRSIGGVPVPLLLISQNMGDQHVSRLMRPISTALTAIAGKTRKRAVVIIARQHAGEVVCSYMVEGLIRFLVGSSDAATMLRENYIFHIVPMVNVDGVIYGNARCTLAGLDPNRVWCDPNPIMHPVVFSLKDYLRKIEHLTPVDLFLDFHGHSQKCGTFFYGCGATDIRNAIFPKIASLASQDILFEECRWKIPGRGHTKTARHVVYKQFDIPASYTIESSFFAQNYPTHNFLMGGLDRRKGPFGNSKEYPFSLFTPFRVESIGMAIGRAMACFFKIQPPDAHPIAILPDAKSFFHSVAVSYDDIFHQDDTRIYPWLTYDKLAHISPDDVFRTLTALGSSVLDLIKDSDFDAAQSHSSDDEKFDNDGEKEDKQKKDRKRTTRPKSHPKKTPRERRRVDEIPHTSREGRSLHNVRKQNSAASSTTDSTHSVSGDAGRARAPSLPLLPSDTSCRVRGEWESDVKDKMTKQPYRFCDMVCGSIDPEPPIKALHIAERPRLKRFEIAKCGGGPGKAGAKNTREITPTDCTLLSDDAVVPSRSQERSSRQVAKRRQAHACRAVSMRARYLADEGKDSTASRGSSSSRSAPSQAHEDRRVRPHDPRVNSMTLQYTGEERVRNRPDRRPERRRQSAQRYTEDTKDAVAVQFPPTWHRMKTTIQSLIEDEADRPCDQVIAEQPMPPLLAHVTRIGNFGMWLRSAAQNNAESEPR